MIITKTCVTDNTTSNEPDQIANNYINAIIARGEVDSQLSENDIYLTLEALIIDNKA